MKKIQLLFIILISVAFLTGCDALTGKEIARIPVNQISVNDSNLIVKETSIALKKGDEIGIWSDMDLEYEGDIYLRFKLEIWKNGEKLGKLEIDPLEKNVTIGEVKTALMNKTNWSFTGKNSEITIEEDATYTFKAILVAVANPTLKVKKAEIVLKK